MIGIQSMVCLMYKGFMILLTKRPDTSFRMILVLTKIKGITYANMIHWNDQRQLLKRGQDLANWNR